MGNGTFVGLDVHARSVVAGLIDEDTGELRVTRAPHRTEELVGWLDGLADPLQVTYEAGADRIRPGARVPGGGDRVPSGRPEPPRALAGRARAQERRLRRRAPGAAAARW